MIEAWTVSMPSSAASWAICSRLSRTTASGTGGVWKRSLEPSIRIITSQSGSVARMPVAGWARRVMPCKVVSNDMPWFTTWQLLTAQSSLEAEGSRVVLV